MNAIKTVQLFLDLQHPYLPLAYYNMINTDSNSGILDKFEPHMFSECHKVSTNNDPDSPSFKEAMQGPYQEEFLNAMGM